ncbi:hypothetical protein A4S06_03735 [Erysipelotrichaceae bacterium MTC7]|nr:hypothetical protein A4S06_03735 [Erysipelotrichaceae bacterium MTC7]
MIKEQYRNIILLSFFGLVCIYMFKLPSFIVIIMMGIVAIYFAIQEEKERTALGKAENMRLHNQIQNVTFQADIRQEQLATLISNLPMPLILLDNKGEVLLYNDGFAEFRDSKEKRRLTYVNNDFVKPVYRFIFDATLFEREIRKTIVVDEKEYEAYSEPLFKNNQFSGCVIVFQDITKIKKQEALQKRFLDDASHELKTPISAIKGMVEILNREGFNDEEIRKDFLEQIENENNRLERIVSDLLQLSRLSSDQLVMKREACDATKIIDASIASLSYKANKKGLAFHTDYRSNEPIFVDPAQLQIVMNNLISNAISYSDTGTISLSTFHEGDSYVIEVKDEGRGISQEEQDRIFERFYRTDTDRSRSSGGSGLGLSIVKSVLDAHQAQLVVKSEIHKGSTFQIWIRN